MNSICTLWKKGPAMVGYRTTFATALMLVATLLFGQVAIAQTISTDKADYAPGETAIITGTGWTNDRYVQVNITEDPPYDPVFQYTVEVANDGSWVMEFPIIDRHLGVTFTALAIGLQSGASATTIFTDAAAYDGSGSMTVLPGFLCDAAVNQNFTFKFVGGSGNNYPEGSQLTLLVPWSITNANIATALVSNVVIGTITTSPSGGGTLVTVNFQNSGNSNNPQFDLTISGVAVPQNAFYQIPVQTKTIAFTQGNNSNAGVLTNISVFPVISSGAGSNGANGTITGGSNN
ncbi:MAG TPA: hypothetical protein VK907_14730, partial [Phnomibacter sp.]|nr:hypothetical protein [Phnomibacter sp.]